MAEKNTKKRGRYDRARREGEGQATLLNSLLRAPLPAFVRQEVLEKKSKRETNICTMLVGRGVIAKTQELKKKETRKGFRIISRPISGDSYAKHLGS